MIYLTPPTTHVISLLYRKQRLGGIITPDSDRPTLFSIPKCTWWAADNGCYSAGERFDADRYLHWLQGLRRNLSNCLFATAPDVLGDHTATWLRSRDWLGALRCLGFKAAFVAQDGLSMESRILWSLFDVLFLGGSTAFKMGRDCRAVTREAKRRGKWVHAGRVNSKKRYDYFAKLGCDSADGTFICFGPDKNIPQVLHWIGEK